MAKTSIIERNKKRQKMAKQYAARRARMKAITRDESLDPEERFEAHLKLAQIPRNASRTRIKNRCQVSGRGKAVYRKFMLSRIALRDLASEGKIPGMVKSSW